VNPTAGLFISYARADEPVALGLYEALVHARQDVWLDKKRLQPGVDWWDCVKLAIDQSSGVLFLVSDESSRSVSCSRELTYAVSCGKRIVPIDIEPAAEYEDWRRRHNDA
jgi:hypothetical protein